MQDKDLAAHQDGAETEDVIDLETFEDESPSDDDELESEDEGQEPIEDNIPELGMANATDEDKKLWTQRWNGLIKLEKRAKANEETLTRARLYLDNEDKLSNLISIGQRFSSKDDALPALSNVVKALKTEHGYSDAEVAKALGLTQAESEVDYDFADDNDIYRRAKEDAKKELEEKFGKKFEQLEKSESERTSRQMQNEFLDKNFTSIKKQVSDMAGANVNLSRAQVETALLAEPEIAKKDPAKAVYVHYLSLIRKVSSRKQRAEKKGPTMVKASQRTGSSNAPTGAMRLSERARSQGHDPGEVFRDMLDI